MAGWALQTLHGTISDLNDIDDEIPVSLHLAEALEQRVELVYRDFLARKMLGELTVDEQTALSLIAEGYSRLRQFTQSIELCSSVDEVQSLLLLDGSVGRPRFRI